MSTQTGPYRPLPYFIRTHKHRRRTTELKAAAALKLEITAVLKLSQVAVSLDGRLVKRVTGCVDVCACTGLLYVRARDSS